MNKLVTSIFLALLIISAEAQPTLNQQQQHTIAKLFKNKGEIYFTFHCSTPAAIDSITKIISIDNVKNLQVWAYANKLGFSKFLQLNITYTVLPNPSSLKKVKTKKSVSFNQMKSLSAYPTYSAYEALMNQFAANYPAICKLVNIGTLASGRKLLLLKISDNINVKENEPQFLYTSSMHGDEVAGYIGMLNYIDYLLSNYGVDTRITYLINNMEIWINPLANPDGTYAGGNNTVNGATRFNANNVDLNRNYPDPAAGIHPDGNGWQPETQAFMSFADTMNFVMSANFHGGSEVFNYPWDTWAALHADSNWWVREAKRYADTVFANSAAGYFKGVSVNGYIDGYAWYTITGGRQDYMNYFKHCREATIELSVTKLLAVTDVATNWNSNYKSWMNYMEEALHGIRGIVKDACTNQPVKAKVFITGHDFDSSHVYSTSAVGNYHRLIYQGNYDVTYSAPGYVSQTISGINVTDGVATVVDVTLNPLTPIANFSATLPAMCGGNVQFTDLSGSASAWNWNFGDSVSSSVQNPFHTYTSSGNYTVRLRASNCAGTDTLTRTSYINIAIADVPIVSNDSSLLCGPASLSLTATSNGTGNWYDAIGGTLLNTGNSYTTPVLVTTTTYYIQNTIGGASQYVGAINNTIGSGGFFTAATYHYLKFTANSAFKLVSVLVNSSTAANRTIELRNSAGIVLQSANIAIPAGSGRITLNFNVPAGVDLQLGIAGANNLYRNTAGGAYPYTLAGIVSITGNSANNLLYYYYFYNWEITQSCASPIVPVVCIINPQTPVNATISSPDSVVCTGNNAFFTASAVNAGINPTYQWFVNGIGAGNTNLFSSVLTNGDLVSCSILSSNTCAINNPSLSNSITVDVLPLPITPTITLSNDTLYSSSANGNNWYEVTNGLIAGATNTYYIPVVAGNYYTITQNSNGCFSDTSNVIAFLSTGIRYLSDAAFQVFPNPANNQIRIDLSYYNHTKVTLELLEAIGSTVFKTETYDNSFSLPTTIFTNGFYLLKVSSENNSKVKSIIIKHE